MCVSANWPWLLHGPCAIEPVYVNHWPGIDKGTSSNCISERVLCFLNASVVWGLKEGPRILRQGLSGLLPFTVMCHVHVLP